MKKILFQCTSLVSLLLLAGCKGAGFFHQQPLTIKTEPYADIYKYDSKDKEPVYETTADSSGIAYMTNSEEDWRRNGYKSFIVAGNGLEPQKVKFYTKFNLRVLKNVFFPWGFLWGHYTTFNRHKDTYLVPMAQAVHPAIYYLEQAMGTSSFSKKKELLEQAYLHDVNNNDGIAAKATLELARMYYNKRDYVHTIYWSRLCEIISGKGGEASKLNSLSYQAIGKQEMRAQNRVAALNAISTGLSTASMALATVNSFNQSSGSGYSVTTHEGNSVSKTKTQKKQGNAAATMNNYHSASTTYGNYVDQLSKMKVGLNRNYSDSERKSIQDKMKQIREENNRQSGRPKINKSDLEDWNGN